MKNGYIWAVPSGIFGILCAIVATIMIVQKDPRIETAALFLILGAIGLGACLGLTIATFRSVPSSKEETQK